MRILKKILLILLIAITTLILAIGLVFSRPNISLEDLEETYFTANSSYVDVWVTDTSGDDMMVSIHVQDIGDPGHPVVVLLHGAFSSSHTFLDWAEVLVANGYRVIMPDLPYFGLSGGFADNITSFRRSAQAIKGVLDHLVVTDIDIAGNSLGGGVSWFFASEYPDMVRTLTLIDAVYPGMEQGGREQLSKITRYDFIANSLSTLTPKFLLRALLKTAYGNPEAFTEETLVRYYDIIRKEGTRKAIIQTTQEEEPDFTYIARLESLTMPVFVMWGEKDTWIDPLTIDMFKDTLGIPASRIMTYPLLGHLPMEEDPATTVLDYLQFIQAI